MDPPDCKCFPLKTGCRCAQVPFKACFTVLGWRRVWSIGGKIVTGENEVYLSQRYPDHNTHFYPHGKHTALITKASQLVNITPCSFSGTDVQEKPSTSIFSPLLFRYRQQVHPTRWCLFIIVHGVNQRGP